MGGYKPASSKLQMEYWEGKQTYKQLSTAHGVSIRTIQRKLFSPTQEYDEEEWKGTSVVVLMDSTYFGKNYGIMVFRDAGTGRNILVKEIKHETLDLYKKGIFQIQQKGIKIRAIVCDGMRGLFNAFPDCPVQMCQFHQMAIIRRYLTQRPRLQASKELRAITKTLTTSTSKDFEGSLDAWNSEWKDFLDERTEVIDNQGKTKKHYTHKRLRSAYLSLRRNLPYLFIFEKYPDLSIPNTTNSLEGQFSELKNKLRCHNGLSRKNRLIFIVRLLKPIY